MSGIGTAALEEDFLPLLGKTLSVLLAVLTLEVKRRQTAPYFCQFAFVLFFSPRKVWLSL